MAEYINREARLQEIDDAFKEYAKNGDMLKLFSECRASIIFAPTADVVEVQHSKLDFIQYCGGGLFVGYCSNCKTEHKAVNPTALKATYRYCRWCGARFDGKGEDNG